MCERQAGGVSEKTGGMMGVGETERGRTAGGKAGRTEACAEK